MALSAFRKISHYWFKKGLGPSWHQAIILISDALFPIRPLWTNRREIFTEIQHFSFKKIYLKNRLQNEGHFVLASLCRRLKNGRSNVVEADIITMIMTAIGPFHYFTLLQYEKPYEYCDFVKCLIHGIHMFTQKPHFDKKWLYHFDTGPLTLRPTQNGRRLADDNFACISWIKKVLFWFLFHWNMFPSVNKTSQ